MAGQQAIIFIAFALHIYRVYIAGRGLDPSAPLPPLSKGGGAAAPEGFLSRWHPYFFKLAVRAGHARPARFRKLLC